MNLPARIFNSPATQAALWAGIMVFLTAGFFYNVHPGWNVNSQFALTCALVEHGTFSIDAYHDQSQFETGDKAFFAGHYYSDKSPVTSLLGTVPLALYKLATGGLHQPVRLYDSARYWTTWLTAGLGAALIAALTALLLIQRGVAPASAARAGALWVGATPLLGYSTIFFNYTPAGALTLGGFLAMAPALRGEPLPARRLALGGLLLGLAAWTLNTVAVFCLTLTAALLLAATAGPPAGGRWHRRWGRLWPWALGGLAGAAGHFIYTGAIFHALTSPYAFESADYFRDQMSHGLMGAAWPRPMVMALITFHPYQGLFLWFPLALLALVGLMMTVHERGAGRPEAAAALAGFVLLLLFNSGYYMWWGGWSSVPRHLIPALALMGLGLAPWLTAPNHGPRRLLLAVGLVGMVANWGSVAYSPQHATGVTAENLMAVKWISVWPSPMLDTLKSFWLYGQLRSPNWGTMLGLAGQASLLPLAAIWAAGWWLSKRIGQGEVEADSLKASKP